MFAVTLGLITVDIFTWIELDVATIFSLPLLLAGATHNRRLLWILAAVLISITFVVYAIQIPENTFTLREPFFINRMLDVATLLLIAALLDIWMVTVKTHKEQQRMIKEQNEKLEAARVSRRMVAIQEAERQALASYLHDLVGQKLTALSINLSVVENRLAPDQASRLDTRLDDSLALVGETIESIRDMAAELRPVVLDDYGLMPALCWYAGQFTKRTDIAIKVKEHGTTRRLPPDVETAFFRITQEALTNVAKYARTQRAMVILEATSQGTCLTVSDEGCGFDATAIFPPDRNHGWGMVIMRERAETVGAQLNVDAIPGYGTRVTVKWNSELR